jgi:phosphate/sulfate permease
VGGKLPKLSDSKSTESILYFSVFSAIIGFAISCAVLQIAYRIKIRYHANSISIRDNHFILIENNEIAYLVKKRPHQLQKPVQPINLEKRKKVRIQKNK